MITTRSGAEAVCALLTPPGEGGIHVIGLAGPGAARIAGRVFRPRRAGKDPLQAGTLSLGHILDGESEIDEVLLLCLPDPEWGVMFEINAHGGPAVAAAVMDVLANLGAETVLPEEFARLSARASGLDRLSIEALIALPDQVSPVLAAALSAQAGGSLSSWTRGALADLDGAIAGSLEAAESFASKAARILSAAPLARAASAPPLVIIAGPRNAGKSSLFNLLLDMERSTVSPEPGTTRDPVREVALFSGLPIELCDTAGIARLPSGAVEEEGMKRAADLIASASAVVLLQSPDAEDAAAAAAMSNPSKTIPVSSKSDLPGPRPAGMIRVSSRTGEGVADLKKLVMRMTGLEGMETHPGPIPFPAEFEALAREALAAVRRHGCPAGGNLADVRARLASMLAGGTMR